MATCVCVSGYVSSGQQDDDEDKYRTAKELVAVSFAAFMSEETVPDDQRSATFRIQAMDERSMFERLKLASMMMKEKRNFMEQKISKTRKQLENDEDAGDAS